MSRKNGGIQPAGMSYDRALAIATRALDNMERQKTIGDRRPLGEQVADLIEDGLNDNQIAEKLGRSRTYILELRREQGYRTNPNGKYRPRLQSSLDIDSQILSLHNERHHIAEIARRLGVSPEPIARRMRRMKLVPVPLKESRAIHNPPPPRVPKHREPPRNKADTSHDDKIRELNSQGYSDTEIAALLGITGKVVFRRRTNLGIPAIDWRAKRTAIRAEFTAKALALHSEGHDDAGIAERLGVSLRTVQHIRAVHNRPINPRKAQP